MSAKLAERTAARPGVIRRIRLAIADGLILTRRNLLHYVRVPTLLVFSTVQPVMFVLLFRFVFGGSIGRALPPGLNYVSYLMPGIFVQTSIFGATATGVGLAEDLGKGIIDRFRSLPMARSAVLAGRTTADLFRNLVVVLLMTSVGYLVGFRFQAGILFAVLAVLLAIGVGWTFSWISATIGLLLKDVESVQAASFVWIFPLTFASSVFVPVDTMPGWLQVWAKADPVSVWANTLRSFTLPGDPQTLNLGSSRLALALQSGLWVAAILAVFVPLAIRAYRRTG
ncbi:MAG: ABC transporter permease [Actinobacteria bacterium]|nr:ABC transporter permease [Actinomycetota bacterium]